MPEIQKLASFIDILQYRETTGPQVDPKKGCFPFVTISRQAGAGGHVLATLIAGKIQKLHAERLFQNWHYDQDLFRCVSQDPALVKTLERLRDTEYHSHAEDMISQLICGGTSQDFVIKKMFHLMRAFALHGKAIFVGHGATLLTRDLPLGIHVRLEASVESRVKRLMRSLNLDAKKAREMVDEKDKAKAELVKTFFSKDVRDTLHYDMLWNTDRVSIEEISKILVEIIRDKAAGSF